MGGLSKDLPARSIVESVGTRSPGGRGSRTLAGLIRGGPPENCRPFGERYVFMVRRSVGRVVAATSARTPADAVAANEADAVVVFRTRATGLDGTDADAFVAAAAQALLLLLSHSPSLAHGSPTAAGAQHSPSKQVWPSGQPQCAQSASSAASSQRTGAPSTQAYPCVTRLLLHAGRHRGSRSIIVALTASPGERTSQDRNPSRHRVSLPSQHIYHGQLHPGSTEPRTDLLPPFAAGAASIPRAKSRGRPARRRPLRSVLR